MKSLSLLFLLYIVLELSSFITAEQSVVIYSAPRSTIPYGFGLLKNGTLKSFTNAPLKGIIDGTCQLSLIGDDLLLVYGQMQYWGQYQVGGLLQFNITSNLWSILGGGNDDARGPPLIDQEIDAVIGITNNNIVVVGDISALPDNIDLNINNVATCNTITGKCKSMGAGLSNYYFATGITSNQDKVYVSYVTPGTLSSLIVTVWNNRTWTTLLNTTAHFPAPDSPFAMAFVNNTLYVAGVKNIVNNTCNNDTIKHIGAWNGTCWKSLNTTAFKILEISEIAISDTGTLYAINDYQTAITRFFNNKWTYLLSAKNSPCSSFQSPMYVNKGTVYVQCEIAHSGGTMAILALNATSGNFTVSNQTMCSSPLSFVIYNDSLWFECTNHDTLALSQYEPNAKEYSAVSLVEDLYTNFPDVEALCSFGKNSVFVKGTFAYAGSVLCEQDFAIWNSTNWTTLSIDGYDPSNNITCGNVSQSLVVAFAMHNSTPGLFWIRIVLVDHITFSTTYYDSPILQTTLQAFVINRLCVVESNIFILIGGIQFTRVAIFNVNSTSWQLTNFTLSQSSINDIVGIGNIIYIGGLFQITNDNGTFVNIAKIDITTMEWLPIEPLLPGPIQDMQIGSLPGLNTTLYAVGTIEEEFNGVAGCNEEGIWTDKVLGGLYNKNFQKVMFIQDTSSFYFLCDADYDNSVYQYDGISLWPILNSGVVDFQIVDVPPPPPTPNIVSTVSTAPNHVVWIVIFSIVALLMLIVSIIVYRITKRKRGYRYIQIPMYNAFDVETNISQLLDDKHIPKIDADNVQFLEIIGGGGQGIVQKALWKGKHIAIKSLPVIDPKLLSGFLQEIKLLSQLHHENIVEFIGVMVKRDENKIWLVTELMDTDLGKVAKLLSYEEKVMVAKSVSKAMVYLHSQKPPVLHRDLKLNNILISKDGRCKVTDFGISRTKPAASAPITRNVGTLTFTAPEVLLDGRYNEKCDVYSMGIVFAELFSGENPFAHVEYEWSLEFIKKFTGKEIGPKIPENVPDKMLDLIKKCLEWEPEDRPNFVEIVDSLNKLNKNFFVSL